MTDGVCMPRTVKYLFIALVVSAILLGCGDNDSPTSISDSLDILDKSPQNSVWYFKIQRWNPQTDSWEVASDSCTVTIDWRFISARSITSGVEVNGGYTALWENSTSEKAQVTIEKLLFVDNNGIPISDFPLRDNFTINPKSTIERIGSFMIALSDIKVSQEIKLMNFLASVIYSVE